MDTGRIADICLISEGSYPYVKGGVGDWIDKIIRNMPDIRFSVFFIGSSRKETGKRKYEFPENLTDYRELFLFENIRKRKRRKISANDVINSHNLMKDILNNRFNRDYFEKWIRHFVEKDFNAADLFGSREFYYMITDLASEYSNENSFIDLYWNIEFICDPVLKILGFLKNIPDCPVYHSVSTGYAGFAGTCLSIIYGRKFILTEHGIYTRERKIDINQSDWIFQGKVNSIFEIEKAVFFKKLWIGFFSFLSKLAYDYSEKIFSITRGNMLTQKNEGASHEKLEIIPNGIEIEKFSLCIRKREKVSTIALVGRVVPVKDILTFIKVAFSVLSEIPELRFEIIGPYEEDLEYYEVCRKFVHILRIEEKVIFTGKVDLSKKLCDIDLLVLTSISEGLPLVILEGFSSGIPAVCTNVGGCSDIILGNPEFENDTDIGFAGEISPPLDINSLSSNIIKIVRDKDLFMKYQENAIRRVNSFYRLEDVIEKYRSYYRKWLE